jgi:DNA invertase Pin-like site-specific DNA recombinase
MLVGYARVSLPEQQLALQEDALRQAGCEKIYTDTVSGKHKERPGLTQALEVVRTGDTLVVWKLDRLGRSLAHLVSVINALQRQGIHFQSLQERIDTTSGGGQTGLSSLCRPGRIRT